MQNLRQHLIAPFAGERRMQRQQFIQSGPKRVDVCAMIQKRASRGDLLGRHVRRRAHELAGHRHARLLQHPRQAEIVDAQSAGWGDQ